MFTTGSVGKLLFKDVVSSVRTAVQQLKSADSAVNIIIAVGHAGFAMDQRVAKEVEDVDIVVGGHTNTFLWTGEWDYSRILQPGLKLDKLYNLPLMS